MKKTIFVILVMLAFTSCGMKSEKVKNFKTDDIVYVKDSQTGLCYGVVASSKFKASGTKSIGIGITCVPCEAVEHLIKE